MVLEIFGFLNMSFVDIIDILVVALVMYVIFRWVRGSAAVNIFIAVIIILFIRVVADSIGMKLVTALMNTVLDLGVLALLIIFQPEVRRFLVRFGNESGIAKGSHKVIHKIFGIQEAKMQTGAIDQIVEACRQMGEQKVGALIVMPHSKDLEYIIETGDRIDAIVSTRLIENIFFKNSPLHDGAMVISGSRIVSARCTLPITDRQDIPASMGMRHRAAIGMSEESDATVIVVSEETGTISVVHDGDIHAISNINELKLKLSAEFGERGAKDNNG